MATFINFNRGPSGLQIKDDQQLNHLTISNKAVINCATLTSQGINCEALDVIGDSTFNGTLVMNGTFFACDISCPTTLTISADDFVQDITNNININALNLTATITNNISLRSASIDMGANTGKIFITGREDEVIVTANDSNNSNGVNACVTTVGHINSRDIFDSTGPTEKYKPVVPAPGSSWSGIVTLTNGSTDTAGKIQLDNAAVAGEKLIVSFGTPFTNAPVVQITVAKPSAAPAGSIELDQVSSTVFVLRLDGAANLTNTLVHYTVIGQSE